MVEDLVSLAIGYRQSLVLQQQRLAQLLASSRDPVALKDALNDFMLGCADSDARRRALDRCARGLAQTLARRDSSPLARSCGAGGK